ncbi:MAG: porin family protein [bacterium]
MKRIIVYTVFLFTATLCNGQSFEAGVIGGLNFANWNTEVQNIERDVTSATKYGIGAVVTYNLNCNYAIQIEPMYLGKGSKINAHDDSPEINVETFYFEIPLLLKASFGEVIRPFVLAGPSLGFFLSGNSKAEVSNLNIEMDLKPITKSTDISLTFGAGAILPVWKGSLFIEGRYSFSLANNSKNGLVEWKYDNTVINIEELSAEENQFKNRGITLMIGYSIPIF